MFKTVPILLALALTSTSVSAASDEEKLQEKKREVLALSRHLVDQYSGLRDPQLLKRLYYQTDKNWQDYTGLYRTNNDLARDLALLRARAATAARSKRTVAETWQTAIKLLPISTKSYRKLGMYAEAANAASAVGDYRAAEQFYAAARLYANMGDKNKETTQLYLRIQELKNTGEGMDWRRLHDRLLDMRKFSETFAIWSLPRLDALLAESEIRMALQPNGDDEKKAVLGDLKAKIELAQKGLDSSIPTMHLERVRTLYYALEDSFGMKPETSYP